jgi:3'-phosphoadenosine 5'-phosphosulfate sulfotransferase (PAPS reductase)/FAD synthetase
MPPATGSASSPFAARSRTARAASSGDWPDSRNRYCTSDLKRGPISTAITMLVKELQDEWRKHCPKGRARPRRERVLNVMGLCAQESADRRMMAPFSHDEDATNKSRRYVDEWLPVHAWTVEMVWADILASGVRYHYAYDLGTPRLSCGACILAPKPALVISARANPRKFARYAAVEQKFAWQKMRATWAVHLASLDGNPPGQFGLAVLRKTWRVGPKFKRDVSIADVLVEPRSGSGWPDRP